VDAGRDVFSFGVVLCEMATGRAPFAGRNLSETLENILHRQTGGAGAISCRAQL